MPADPNRVRDVFLAAVELSPEQRPAYLAEACGGDADLRAEVDRLLVANADPDSILEPASSHPGDATLRSSPASRDPDFRAERPPPRSTRTRRAPRRSRPRCTAARTGPTGTFDRPDPDATTAAASASPRPRSQGPDGRRDRHRHRRPVHARRGDRRGGHGLGVSGQPDRAGQAAGGAQADQDGDGFAGRAGPVRRRAAGPRADGPPQHRPHLRRRPHPGRPAVLRHGAGQGGAAHRVLRPAAADGEGPAGAVRRGLPGGAARPPEGDHPPRPQARKRAGHGGGWPADAEGDRLRRGEGDRSEADRHEPGRRRGDRRHAGVHVAGAGRPVVDGHRHPHRCLCPRGDALRAAHRLAADRRQAVPARGDPGNAADGARGRSAAARAPS